MSREDLDPVPPSSDARTWRRSLPASADALYQHMEAGLTHALAVGPNAASFSVWLHMTRSRLPFTTLALDPSAKSLGATRRDPGTGSSETDSAKRPALTPLTPSRLQAGAGNGAPPNISIDTLQRVWLRTQDGSMGPGPGALQGPILMTSLDWKPLAWGVLGALAVTTSMHRLRATSWPSASSQAGTAMSMAAELVHGYGALAAATPWLGVLQARYFWSHVTLEPTAATQLEHLLATWERSLQRWEGSGLWLFGDYSVVDEVAAPWALRLLVYGLVRAKSHPLTHTYACRVACLPEVQQWVKRQQALNTARMKASSNPSDSSGAQHTPLCAWYLGCNEAERVSAQWGELWSQDTYLVSPHLANPAASEPTAATATRPATTQYRSRSPPMDSDDAGSLSVSPPPTRSSFASPPTRVKSNVTRLPLSTVSTHNSTVDDTLLALPRSSAGAATSFSPTNTPVVPQLVLTKKRGSLDSGTASSTIGGDTSPLTVTPPSSSQPSSPTMSPTSTPSDSGRVSCKIHMRKRGPTLPGSTTRWRAAQCATEGPKLLLWCPPEARKPKAIRLPLVKLSPHVPDLPTCIGLTASPDRSAGYLRRGQSLLVAFASEDVSADWTLRLTKIKFADLYQAAADDHALDDVSSSSDSDDGGPFVAPAPVRGPDAARTTDRHRSNLLTYCSLSPSSATVPRLHEVRQLLLHNRVQDVVRLLVCDTSMALLHAVHRVIQSTVVVGGRNLAPSVASLVLALGQERHVIQWAAQREVASANNPTDMFREDNVASWLLVALCHVQLQEWLDAVLAPVQKKLSSTSTVDDKRIMRLATMVLQELVKQLPTCPYGVRSLFRWIRKPVQKRWPAHWRGPLAIIIYLRIIGPTLCQRVSTNRVDPTKQRSMWIAVAKQVVNLTNLFVMQDYNCLIPSSRRTPWVRANVDYLRKLASQIPHRNTDAPQGCVSRTQQQQATQDCVLFLEDNVDPIMDVLHLDGFVREEHSHSDAEQEEDDVESTALLQLEKALTMALGAAE